MIDLTDAKSNLQIYMNMFFNDILSICICDL